MLEFLNANLYGLIDLPWWGYVLWTLVWMHITLLAITLYFHREQAHRSLDLHPVVQHFFRFWLWITTGAPTKEWVAVHRKHHALCEREGDPHSPQIFGLKRVVLEGAELYKEEAAKQETLEKYGKGTPDDWIERNVYSRFDYTGITLLVLFNLVCFGAPGIIMLAAQLATMPALAAGIINGVCHAKGYRNFETNDASTNLWRFGVIIGGEELHNNHHAFPTSAKFSIRRNEFDVGWLYLRVLSFLGLAKVRRVASQPLLDAAAAAAREESESDLDTVRGILVNRMHVLRAYMNTVTLPVLRRELGRQGGKPDRKLTEIRNWLTWQPQMLKESDRRTLGEIAGELPAFEQVLQYRNELKKLWEGRHTSNEKLLDDFRNWCRRAEASGNQYLEEFVGYLRSYRAEPSAA